MATIYYANQYFTTTLSVVGGIDDSQTTGIVLSGVSGLDITKPGIALISYADPLDTATAEWVKYTSINGSNELQGVIRGTEGFSAKAHTNGASIAFPVSEAHVNNLADRLTGVDTTALSDTNGNELLKTSTTGSAVNEITLTNAATGNSPQISATGGDTNISLDLRGKGEGVTKGGIRYQSNTTNSNQNGVWIQSGWGFFVGDGDTSATESITFPTAFTTILSVVASGIGYKDSSDPSGIGDFGDYGVYANVNSISTTGCNISLNIPAGSIGATRRVGYSWIAIGI